MAYLKEILPKTSCNLNILQDNGTKLKNNHLISTFKSLVINRIYSNPLFAKGNGRVENVHNLLKRTTPTFIHNSTLEWDDALPLVIYCFNGAPSVNECESHFYLVHERDPLEGRLSHLQNYCRYTGQQPDRLAVQEPRNMWKMHAKLLWESIQ